MNYASKIGWSDIDPYEIVKRVSEKCLEVREMDSERDPFWRPEAEVGGFLAHVKNNVDQRCIRMAGGAISSAISTGWQINRKNFTTTISEVKNEQGIEKRAGRVH